MREIGSHDDRDVASFPQLHHAGTNVERREFFTRDRPNEAHSKKRATLAEPSGKSDFERGILRDPRRDTTQRGGLDRVERDDERVCPSPCHGPPPLGPGTRAVYPPGATQQTGAPVTEDGSPITLDLVFPVHVRSRLRDMISLHNGNERRDTVLDFS